MNVQDYEGQMPVARVEGLLFAAPNALCLGRAQDLRTKEPDTIAWIDGMAPGQMFFDVGANVGIYTIYAATRGLRVLAFEPEAQNFAVLCRNIALNRLTDTLAFPMALAAELRVDTLRVAQPIAGISQTTFGADLDHRGQPRAFPFRQGAVALPMDAFASRFGAPDHIKIDVDGLEHEVVAGGLDAISKAKSVLIEIDSTTPRHMELYDVMRARGFSWDEAQVEAAQRKDGPFAGIGNVIFTRRA